MNYIKYIPLLAYSLCIFLHPYTNTYILIHYYPVFTKVKTGDCYYFYSKILIIDLCQEMLKNSKINFDFPK